MTERVKPWYETDVPRVTHETDLLYARLIEKDPHKTKISVTKEKIIEAREWAPSLKIYEKQFDQVLTQLGYFYVPKLVIPGPAFIFPIRGFEGKYTMAQTKPLEGSSLSLQGMKYRYIGDKPVVPRWLGNDFPTLKKIIDLKKVMVVEGSFDLLAAKLVCPDMPILSPLTKTLGKKHIAYLRMLGVRDVLMMFDNEEAKGKDKDGAGNMSMAQHAASIKTMKVHILTCPKSDPSSCLKHPVYAEKLKARIMAEF